MTAAEMAPARAVPRSRLGWIFTGLVLAIFLASLDQTNVMVPQTFSAGQRPATPLWAGPSAVSADVSRARPAFAG
jgi:hypothetical protein